MDGQCDETCDWEQGDASLGSPPFVTLEPSDDSEEFEAAFYETPGFVLVSQTCDVLRREDVQVAALRQVPAQELELTRQRRRTQFAYLPQIARHGLVVDLDQVMTVKKSVLARFEKIRWVLNDGDRRLFADALARHKERFAFPDDFVAAMQPLRKRLDDKKKKDSAEGRLIRATSELRVSALPSWDDSATELTLYCILMDDAHSNDRAEWLPILKTWEAMCKLPARMKFGGAILCTYDEITAAELLGSDKLDLDFMSA